MAMVCQKNLLEWKRKEQVTVMAAGGRDSANTSSFSLFKELARIKDASVFFKMILVSDKRLFPVCNSHLYFLQQALANWNCVFCLPSHKCFPATGRKHQRTQWSRAFHCLRPTGRFHSKHHNGKCPPTPNTVRCLPSSSCAWVSCGYALN